MAVSANPMVDRGIPTFNVLLVQLNNTKSAPILLRLARDRWQFRIFDLHTMR
jgi:hypothetical protein